MLRRLHRWLAPWIFLPLLITVSSGVTYRLARDWAGLEKDQVHWLMVLHEGEWLGPQLESIVVLLNAFGLLWMLLTGTGMLVRRVEARPKPKPLMED